MPMTDLLLGLVCGVWLAYLLGLYAQLRRDGIL
jgi:hypothetical protein